MNVSEKVDVKTQLEERLEVFDRDFVRTQFFWLAKKDQNKALQRIEMLTKFLESIKEEFNLCEAFPIYNNRIVGLESLKEFFGQQNIKSKRNKTARKLSKREEKDAFLNACIQENKQQLISSGQSSKSVAEPRGRRGRDPRMKALIEEYRALRGNNLQYAQWSAANNVEEEQEEDFIPICKAPLVLMNKAESDSKIKKLTDVIGAASVNYTWYYNGGEKKVDAFYFVPDPSSYKQMKKNGDFPNGIRRVDVLGIGENWISMNMLTSNVGCDDYGNYYFESQNYPGKTFAVKEIIVVEQDPNNPMVKFFRILQENGALVAKDNNEKTYALDTTSGIHFAADGTKYRLIERSDALYMQGPESRHEFIVFTQNQDVERQSSQEDLGHARSVIIDLLVKSVPKEVIFNLGKNFKSM